MHILNKAISKGLFNLDYYCKQRGKIFNTIEDGFEDYCKIGRFSEVNPSENFDGVQYLQNNHDVYNNELNPLIHYIEYGEQEGRLPIIGSKKWNPCTEINVSKAVKKKDYDIAIVLHIYYEDYLEKYKEILSNYFTEFSLYITTPFDEIAYKSDLFFKSNPLIKKLKITKTPNKGRNFGPFLVEYADDLINHKYIIHLHSKKSLHSGRVQDQWASYLTEYLLADKEHIEKVLQVFEDNENYGLFYPKTFWCLPSWVNHWLKNKSQGSAYLKKELGIDIENDFLAYPVGGMFISKTKALRKLLKKQWSYDDWPNEPIAADGTILHVLERALPYYVKEAGYEQFFFDTRTGKYTDDDSYIFSPYLNDSVESLKNTALSRSVISFDIFDTLLYRDNFYPDLHKKLVPKILGLAIDGETYHQLRDSSENEIRKRKNWQGDIDLLEICEEVATHLSEGSRANAIDLMNTEFELDLARIKPKSEILEIANSCISDGKKVIVVSDTYYTEEQIKKILKKIGLLPTHELFVSSKLKKRKDRGDMWDFVKEYLEKEFHIFDFHCQFIHIGDNVQADAQNVGDRNMSSFHILNPMDKWQSIKNKKINREKNLDYWKYFGPLITAFGRNPFI